MMRTFFNRPVLMTVLMAIAGVTFLYIRHDGFRERHLVPPGVMRGGEVKFLEAASREAFNVQFADWMRTSGYEASEKGWREITGKAAASDGTGVREDLQVYVKRLSRSSYQAWGVGQPTGDFKLLQVYRAMRVSEWSKEKADAFRDTFENEAQRVSNLTNIGRTF